MSVMSIKRGIMVINNINTTAEAVTLMEKHLRNELLKKDGEIIKKKLWENTYIKHQIDRRLRGESFDIKDHIRAIVYSMLSSRISWSRVESGIDIKTGKISPLDEIFHNYDPDFLLKCNPDELAEKIKELGCASQSTRKQMKALIHTNIPKILKLQEEYSSVDIFYKKLIDIDCSLKTLVLILSSADSKYKFFEMGEALVAEYLKNVGYDIAKPDRHICRILGSNYLACSNCETVPIYETIDIVAELANILNKSADEVDYILWSYCANGYGEICTKNKPKCDVCVANKICKRRTQSHE